MYTAGSHAAGARVVCQTHVLAITCTQDLQHLQDLHLQVLPAEAQGRISILASRQDTTVPDVFAKSLKRRCSCQQRRALVSVHWQEHVLMCRGDVIVAACCPLAVSALL